MPTPPVHLATVVLAGVWLSARRAMPRSEAWGLLIAALFADLDFLPGMAVGEVLRFHHGASHSLAVALFGALVLRGMFGGSFMALLSLALGHLVLDALTADTLGWYPGHRGLRFFWPFSGAELEPLALFAAPYVGSDLSRLLSWTNVRILLFDSGVGAFLSGVCIAVGPTARGGT